MWPYGFNQYQGGPRYVGEGEGKFSKAALANINPGMLAAAQYDAGMMPPGYGPDPAALYNAYQQGQGYPPPGYGQMPPGMPPGGPVRWRGPFPISNAYAGPFDPAMVTQDMPTKLNRMVQPLGSVTIAAGGTGVLQATIQRTIRPRKIVLVGTGATDLNVADIVSLTCNGDNLTAGGGVFPAATYANVDSLDNITADFYTSGAVFSLTLSNPSVAAIIIRGSLIGDTAR